VTTRQVLVSSNDTNNAGFNALTAGWSGTITTTVFGTLTNQFNGLTVSSLLFNTPLKKLILILPGTLPQTFFKSLTISDVTNPSDTDPVTVLSTNAAEYITSVDASGNELTYFSWDFPSSTPISTGATYYVDVANDTATLTTSFNCECVDQNLNETLGALRRRMLVRLGYSAQADNPPPGMTDLLDDFLRSAQRVLYLRYKQFQIERFFKWTLVPNVRFYDFANNDDQCGKRLDARTVTGVWLKDLNNVWFDMRQGIPPAYYTSSAFPGYPSRYEFRSCIEIFPAPSAAYEMYIKGRFGLDRLTQDADQTTVDSELVFLTALSRAKAHYNQPDASATAADANSYLAELIRSGHQGARYVPGVAPSAPWTKPHFLPLDNP